MNSSSVFTGAIVVDASIAVAVSAKETGVEPQAAAALGH